MKKFEEHKKHNALVRHRMSCKHDFYITYEKSAFPELVELTCSKCGVIQSYGTLIMWKTLGIITNNCFVKYRDELMKN